jgi:hypothetical protein
MIGNATVTMDGMDIAEMPLGDMLSAVKERDPRGGGLPAMEITGTWALTLSSASIKSGSQS